MKDPRFISVDTSLLNDGDLLRYDTATHRIMGVASGESGENVAPLSIRVIELTGHKTLTTEEIGARVLVFRGALSSPATITFPSLGFCALVINQTTQTLTITRTGGTAPTPLAPNTGDDFFYIP
ncbi:hypothetical protein IAD21_00702 [Abditibacteriota bacterium]|nr:hypothetical protein IAD21_00702 [Abditibacteriota bacterium]